MKACLKIIIISLFSSLTCFAQKDLLDSNAFKRWSTVNFPQISNNGLYVLYTVENQPLGERTLVVQNTKNSWKLEILNSSGLITSDSKYVILKKGKDSLGILKTGSNIVHYIPYVQSFSVSKNVNEKNILYQLNTTQRTLIIYNLETEKVKYAFSFVKQYLLSEDGSTLLFLTEEKKDTLTQGLHLLNLVSGDIKNIWQGTNAKNIILNKNNKQIAFRVEQSNYDQTKNTFCYYKFGMDKAIEVIFNHVNQSISNKNTLQIESLGSFSEDDSCLYINLNQMESKRPQPSPVDVWSYTDEKLQSIQLLEKYSRTYRAVINLQNFNLVRLENENEMLLSPSLKSKENNWGLIMRRPGDPDEAEWNVNAFVSVELVSKKDGRRKIIPGLSDIRVEISPSGRFLVYYDRKQKDYFSYEIESGITRNLTKGSSVSWIGYLKDMPMSDNIPRGLAGWLKKDEAVFIYDENDIWQVDIAGEKKPVNITNGYGKKHDIVFSFDLREYGLRTLSSNERLILNAFNLVTKDNGYFSKTLSKTGDPELLSMGPYFYNIPDNPYIPGSSNFPLVKALQAEVYLMQRMSANESPNFFCTSDFKTFTPLSDVHPEKKYNWLTAELVTWKALDGRSLQGILYKPENFDPQKKYPVIFNYYERKSDGLHVFLEPDFLSSGGNINIPWYTSNGYLVFLPDIHYKIGETGESVINCVVSAAQFLSQMPWVNSKKMGIQGFSFGGYETNFLVTHSNIFAAACSASGLSNLISAYGSLTDAGGSLQLFVESSQPRMGASLWERPELYIKNSPIFAANHVTTPLLMMHTKQDGVCLFSNAIEFFIGLRRLNKKAWLLQYQGNHGLTGSAAIDFSTRLAQFFDHYLKDAPAPKWMTKGIPAKYKGIDMGLDFTQK